MLKFTLARDIRVRMHDYTDLIEGRDYVLEAASESAEKDEFYMTGYGKGIKPHDQILIKSGADTVQFLVKQIDYYCDPPDAWIALLVKRP